MYRYPVFLRYPALIMALVMVFNSGIVQAAKIWYPVEVDVWEPPFNNNFQRQPHQYTPLDKASRRWNICVSIPHLKDAYWLAVNYGLIAEARRLNVGLSLYEAGGYEKLAKQRKQIEDCLAGDADGLIVSAISNDGLEDLIKIAADRGIPVLDLINGMSSTHLDARVAADYGELGSQTATYLRKLHHDSDQPVRVAWFPGPEGAAWVDAGNAGFRDALKGSPIEIVSTSMGDTGHATQSRLLEIVLDEHADELDYIVGTAVTAEAAADVLRRRGLSKSIQVLSYYYSPGVHRGIKRGNIVAAPSDQTALQARIAVDVMVRMLEKQDYFKHVAPRIVLVDGGKLRGWDSSTTLAPRGFRPIFSINN
jgi:periplasmic protein TorT